MSDAATSHTGPDHAPSAAAEAGAEPRFDVERLDCYRVALE